MPVDPVTLNSEENRNALSALFFLTEECDGNIRGRNYTIGSKQCTCDVYNKSDGTLLMVSMNGLIITSTIDAHEVCEWQFLTFLGHLSRLKMTSSSERAWGVS